MHEGKWTEEDEQLAAGRSSEQRGVTADGSQFQPAKETVTALYGQCDSCCDGIAGGWISDQKHRATAKR